MSRRCHNNNNSGEHEAADVGHGIHDSGSGLRLSVVACEAENGWKRGAQVAGCFGPLCNEMSAISIMLEDSKLPLVEPSVACVYVRWMNLPESVENRHRSEMSGADYPG